MPKFDKKYVHFMWDDELEGKAVFYSDSVDLLQILVANNDSLYKGVVHKSGSRDFPFEIRVSPSDIFRFCYYDPYYELKLANEQGKVIQFHELNSDWYEWIDCENEPDWSYPPERYRIKSYEDNRIKSDEDISSSGRFKSGKFKFDHGFVHFVWDPILEGKSVYYADDVDTLAQNMKDGLRRQLVNRSHDPRNPFSIPGVMQDRAFKFAYYDPSWDEESEQSESNRVTHIELARWVEQGNGQWRHSYSDIFNTHVTYMKTDENVLLGNTTLVRKWGDTEWHEPTRGYMGLGKEKS